MVVAQYFIFSQNLFSRHPADFFPEAWSLSIEEWFYVFVPIVIFFLIKCFKLYPKYAVLVTSLFMIIAVTLFRFVRFEHLTFINEDEWDLLFRKQVSTRFVSLMYGVLGAYIHFYYPGRWLRHRKVLLVAGILLLVFSRLIIPQHFFVGWFYHCVFSFTMISVATLFLLPFLSSLRHGKGMWYKPVTYLSLISYSMYLLNLSLVQRLVNKINWHRFFVNDALITGIKYFLFWLLTIVLSILLYKYFEAPATQLRDKPARNLK